MDAHVSPLESSLAWTVDFEPLERDFISRRALNQQQFRGLDKKLVGLMLLEKGILRSHQRLFRNQQRGTVTSGYFFPTLKKSIALARIHSNIQDDCLVEIRCQLLKAKIVQPPFVRRRHAQNT